MSWVYLIIGFIIWIIFSTSIENNPRFGSVISQIIGWTFKITILLFFLSTPFIYIYLLNNKENFNTFFQLFSILGYAVVIYFIFLVLKKKGVIKTLFKS